MIVVYKILIKHKSSFYILSFLLAKTHKLIMSSPVDGYEFARMVFCEFQKLINFRRPSNGLRRLVIMPQVVQINDNMIIEKIGKSPIYGCRGS